MTTSPLKTPNGRRSGREADEWKRYFLDTSEVLGRSG
jgi:hypothetical protein